MTIGRVLYENLFRDPDVTSVTYSEAEVAGFEKENSFDWRDFSLFRIAPTAKLDFTFSVDKVLDTFCAYVIPSDAGDLSFGLKYENIPASFLTLAIYLETAGDPPIIMKTFDQVTLLAGRILRVEFTSTGPEDIRQLVAGTRLDFPIGQHRGIAPPNLRGEFVTSNLISVNGSFIGRDKVRAEIQGEINLEFVQPQTFVRDEWLALMAHAERFAFFYAWDLDGFPDEVVFAWARSTPRPSNTGPSAKMTTNLPWSALAT